MGRTKQKDGALCTVPTRVTGASATLIDPIWVSQPETNISNYIIQTDITDHFAVVSQFTDHSTGQCKPVYINKRVLTQTAVQNISNDLAEAFAWEPVNNKFGIIAGEPPSVSVTFFQVNKGQEPTELKKVEKRPCNNLFWSPQGQFVVLAGLRSMNGGAGVY
ncbi:Eukaryotic translation initiation factor 3 subunit B [Chionoecetes opilio]|uniref:Eukaryotic translation initiation factor 3 subunit B n=1 Tax=Chionoecetes opilio TaxID=41210 RepID=A0A8J4Y2A0_CHIOP|nr:Eukaryotic translation initiation factor 3 subunit B [Chionoecetes opilio]